MPFKIINGIEIYYEIQGIGPETMIFCHGLFFSSKIFKGQVDYFKARYKCVTFDYRGQGRSEVSENGYDYDSLTTDTISLIKELKLGPCHMVGHSSGGAIAMRVACRHREFLKSLVLIDTTANSESTKFRFNLMKSVIQVLGIKLVFNTIMKQWFGSDFLSDEMRVEEAEYWRNQLIKNEKSIFKSLSAFINRESIISELSNIPMPTLIIVGDEDALTPPEKSKNIKLKIPQARLAIIKGSGHCSIVEEPWQVIEAIEVFLNGVH